MAVVLREEVSLLDVQLGEVVVAYIEHLEREGELELEVATEFLVLIAALLELKSRLMLPGRRGRARRAQPGGGDRGAAGADARVPPLPRRLGGAGRPLRGQRGYLYRSAPLPRELRRVALEAATAVYDPDRLGAALGDLLTQPPDVDISHIRPTVSLERRLAPCATSSAAAPARLRRGVRRRGPADPGGDALRPARALPQRRVTWKQSEPFGPIETVRKAVAPSDERPRPHRSKRCSSSRRSRSAPPTWRGDRGDRGPGRRGDRAAARGPRRRASAGSSCARSPAASPWPATRPARKRRGGCWPSRGRRR